MPRLASVVLSILLCAAPPAQSVWSVGNGGSFAQIGDVFAVATPGDVVYVSPGAYFPFVATVGVKILTTGPVWIDGTSGLGAVLCDIPIGQTLDLSGLFLRNPLVVLRGRVTLDECVIAPTLPFECVIVADAILHMQDTYVVSPSTTASALRAFGSAVTVEGGELRTDGFGSVAPVVDVIGSRFQASSTHVRNGLWLTGGGCLRAQGTSEVWIADSRLDAGVAAACAIDNAGASVRLDRCAIGQVGSSCPAGTPGLLLGVSRSAPLRRGQPFALEFQSAPFSIVLLFAGPELDLVDWRPLQEQPGWLLEQDQWFVTAMLTDAQGAADVAWLIPGTPGLAGATMWFKGLSGLGLPLQASPVVGGMVR